jgi:glycosyltransferase involved in cell wall biosynthesis
MNKPKTTVIVPAYNEEKGIPVVLTKLLKVVNDEYEVIVVDDGSKDGTAEAAGKFPVKLIKHEINKGKGEAFKTGIAQATGENIIVIDADDTYPVDAIVKMVEALKTCDAVYGSRSNGRENIPPFNRLGNTIFQGLVRYVYGFTPKDYSTGLYGLKKKYLVMMKLSSKRFAIEPEICIKASRMKLKMVDIPIIYGLRIGSSKLGSIKVGLEHSTWILKLLFWRPVKQK